MLDFLNSLQQKFIKDDHKLGIFRIKPIYILLLSYFLLLLILCVLRNTTGDETYYLQETMLISELFKKGIWIGNYGVGLHGFLFKLPVALVFIILGKPFVFAATLFTVSLSLISIYLCYKIFRKYFFNEKLSLLCTGLFSVSLYFINSSISFNRDIPAVLIVLVFFYLFLNKSNKWWIALSLLLMLDAKEHVFLTVAPLYGLYLLITGIQAIKKKGWLKSLWETFRDILIAYILPIIWIVLMFTTSLIPVNMFIASIGGLVTTGNAWNESQFAPATASSNLLGSDGKQMVKLSSLIDIGCNEEVESSSIGESCETFDFKCRTLDFIDTVLSYIGKILYPRTFSFISIPKIIVLPALVVAFNQFLLWWKKKDFKYVLPMILFFNILILILRTSHGRYLLCVSPLLMLFFVIFIKDFYKNIPFSKTVLIYTTIFVLLGLYFESTFLLPKIILEIGLLILFWGLYFFKEQIFQFKSHLKIFFIACLALGMLFTQLAFSYSIGQIGNYLKYGYNRETPQILKNFEEKEVIWINEYGSENLLRVFRKDLAINPEWEWQLSEQLPKNNLFEIYPDERTFSFPVIDVDQFQDNVKTKKIEKVVLVVSLFEDDSFMERDRLDEFKGLDWLQLEEEVEMKNKMMYIFNVED